MINVDALSRYTSEILASVLSSIDAHWYALFFGVVIVTLIVQFYAKSVFKANSLKNSNRMMSGLDAAELMLSMNYVHCVPIVSVSGQMTDHYDPISKEIRLSESVYSTSSISAIAIACHEAGHAIQFAHGSPWIKIRNAVSATFDLTTSGLVIMVMVGLLLGAEELVSSFVYLGMIFYGVAFAFKLATIPIEFDASNRALDAFERGNILDVREREIAKKVLFACAFTYVASILSTFLNLLRFLSISKKRK